MRRTHLRKHGNILKRQLIHVAGFNLSLIFRKLLGAGTPREWINRGGRLLLFFMSLFTRRPVGRRPCRSLFARTRLTSAAPTPLSAHSKRCRKIAAYTTGC
jgi:hypothetical protein